MKWSRAATFWVWLSCVALVLHVTALTLALVGDRIEPVPDPIVTIDGRPATAEEIDQVNRDSVRIFSGVIDYYLGSNKQAFDNLQLETGDDGPVEIVIESPHRLTARIAEWFFWIGLPAALVGAVVGLSARLAGDERLRVYFCMWPFAVVYVIIQGVAGFGG